MECDGKGWSTSTAAEKYNQAILSTGWSRWHELSFQITYVSAFLEINIFAPHPGEKMFFQGPIVPAKAVEKKKLRPAVHHSNPPRWTLLRLLLPRLSSYAAGLHERGRRREVGLRATAARAELQPYLKPPLAQKMVNFLKQTCLEKSWINPKIVFLVNHATPHRKLWYLVFCMLQ